MKKIKTIKLMLPAGDPKSGQQPLGPVLGQNQINLMSFCTDFNQISESICKGIDLPTKVYKFSDKSYKVVINHPSVKELIFQIIKSNQGEENVITYPFIQDLLKIIKGFHPSLSEKSLLKVLLSNLFSMKLQ